MKSLRKHIETILEEVTKNYFKLKKNNADVIEQWREKVITGKLNDTDLFILKAGKTNSMHTEYVMSGKQDDSD